MKVVIIEDEKYTAEDLAETIMKVEPNARIDATLYSVSESIAYFRKHNHPDLIFSDIQLGDGLSFEIFKAVSVPTPVIFCTAYDEYALQAFKVNGIDYLLKPFTQKTIAQTLAKYRTFKNNFFKSSQNYEIISELFENRKDKQDTSSVLIYSGDKILPVRISDIALFFIEDEKTNLLTFHRSIYSINKTLEELEKTTGSTFFRANRQYLVNRLAIKEASQYFHRKLIINLSIPFQGTITISKAKVPEFLNWLSGD